MTTTLSPHAAELINRLRVRGVRLVADGSRLKASPRSLLTDSDRATIRERKAELLTLLTAPIAGAGDITQPIPEEKWGYVTSTTIHEPENKATEPLPTWPGWLWNAIDGLFPVDAAGRTVQPQISRWTRYDRPWMPWSESDATLVEWFESHRDQLPAEPFTLKRGVEVALPVKFYAAIEADIRTGSNGPRAAGLLDDLAGLRKLMAESKSGGRNDRSIVPKNNEGRDVPAPQRTDVRK